MNTNTISIKSIFSDFKAITKAGLAISVLFSSIAGYLLGFDEANPFSWLVLLKLIIGGYCMVGASNAFNQVIEKDLDALMDRTKNRPVPKVAIWHKDGKMVIALDVLGTINGTLYLSGFPQYNDLTKELFFDKLDYALDTKNKLMRTANWLAQGLVLRKIQESCRYSIVPNLEEGKQNIMPYLKNYSPMTGVFVNGKMDDIQFQKIQLTNKAIIAFIKVNGTVSVAVDGLK